MKFELNEYHRNIPDEDLIADVKNTANKMGVNSLNKKEYSKNGKYSASTLCRRFGSWKTVLELSNLEVTGHPFLFEMTDNDVIEDLRRVALLCCKETITMRDYDKFGKYHSSTLTSRYKTWNNVLSMAQMKLNLNRNFSDEDMFKEIARIWTLLGRQPTTTDIKDGMSIFSLNTYARRFGSWRGALQAFIDWINLDNNTEYNENISLSDKTTVDSDNFKSDNKYVAKHRHKTPREVNYRLRFKVLQRDNFKCCFCGASPAKDPSVDLDIDHILPWSKGGETVMENLQTLCKKCNLGKSDLVD